MSAADEALYNRWEREVREASVKGLEEILPPVAQWPSFLISEQVDLASAMAFEAVDMSARDALDRALYSTSPAAEKGGEAPAGVGAPHPAQGPGGPAKALPESQLPDPLRAEIEEFLNRDKPTGPSEEDFDAFVKGGLDPNLDPED